MLVRKYLEKAQKGLQNPKGSALIWAVSLIAILLILVVGILSISLAFATHSVNNNARKQAYFTSRSVVDAIAAEICHKEGTKPAPTPAGKQMLDHLNTSSTYDLGKARFGGPSEGMGNSTASLSKKIEIAADGSKKMMIYITAVTTVGNETQTVVGKLLGKEILEDKDLFNGIMANNIGIQPNTNPVATELPPLTTAQGTDLYSGDYMQLTNNKTTAIHCKGNVYDSGMGIEFYTVDGDEARSAVIHGMVVAKGGVDFMNSQNITIGSSGTTCPIKLCDLQDQTDPLKSGVYTDGNITIRNTTGSTKITINGDVYCNMLSITPPKGSYTMNVTINGTLYTKTKVNDKTKTYVKAHDIKQLQSTDVIVGTDPALQPKAVVYLPPFKQLKTPPIDKAIDLTASGDYDVDELQLMGGENYKITKSISCRTLSVSGTEPITVQIESGAKLTVGTMTGVTYTPPTATTASGLSPYITFFMKADSSFVGNPTAGGNSQYFGYFYGELQGIKSATVALGDRNNTQSILHFYGGAIMQGGTFNANGQMQAFYAPPARVSSGIEWTQVKYESGS